MCVTASDAQLNDVSRCCAIPKRGVAEVMPVDLTFKLRELYVLVTSFKNPMLANKLGKHPNYIGPSKYNIENCCHHIDILEVV